jgi:hypothetical protein
MCWSTFVFRSTASSVLRVLRRDSQGMSRCVVVGGRIPSQCRIDTVAVSSREPVKESNRSTAEVTYRLGIDDLLDAANAVEV